MKTSKTDLAKDLTEARSSFFDRAASRMGVAPWRMIRDGSGQLAVELGSGCATLLNANVADFDGTLNSFILFFHPTDRESLRVALDQLIAGRGDLSGEFRLDDLENAPRWLSLFADQEDSGFEGLIQDVTSRRVTEDSLLKVYERYEFLTKATKDAIWDWDYEHDFITWNHGVETIFGYKEREVNGAGTWRKRRIFSDDYGRVEDELVDAFAHHLSNWQSTYRMSCADGSIKHVYDRAYIIYQGKKPIRLLGSMQDITGSIQAMEEIKKLSLVASSTDNMVFMLDHGGRIEWVNESFFATLGYTLAEASGKDPQTILLGPDTDKAVLERILEAVRKAEPVSEELLMYSKSGKKVWVKLLMNPVFDDERNLSHFVTVGSDISDQKEFERNITAIVRELATLIENANVPIFGLDRNGYINEWNKVTESISGYKKNEILGRRFADQFLEPENVKPFEDVVDTVIKGNPVSNFQLQVVTRTLSKRMLLMGASPRINTAMEPTGIIVVAQDITELVEYRAGLEKMVDERTHKLNEALKKEKELLDLRSRFVSIASHEFRTPLSTISLAAGYLDRYFGKLSEGDARVKIASILRQVDHMKVLLDDVLLVGKADAGKIQVQKAPLAVFSWLDQLAEEVQLSSGNTHQIEVKHSGTEDYFFTDEKLMRNIVINLLTNAVKFSPDGGKVEVDVSVDEEQFRLEVKDYGVGIPAEDQKNLFTPFYRAGNVSNIKGTGLGLSIVKKAVELLGGTLALESKPGSGTRFRIVLSALPPDKK